ncbi:phasin family protein [Gorillibacterium timonense]|uniref:phasin family protein n=1 Tax=Gorillibacterium timonense TaxID=1689269 RepID=UPI000D528A66|nr:polyhydroxyalkanoate synthesis regulator [Gorillibacterium timonense]
MSDLLRKAINLGVGLAVASKEKIEQYADELVAKGELGKNESKDFVNQLIHKGEEQRDELKGMVREQVNKVLAELDIATLQDIRRLEVRVAALEEALRKERTAPVSPVAGAEGVLSPNETATAKGDVAAANGDASTSDSAESAEGPDRLIP